MKVLLFLIIFIGFSFLTACQPVGKVAELSGLNRAPSIAFTSTLEIDLSNHTAYSLTGTCSENGQDVTITGAINATTVCAFGVWSQTIDFSSYPDGLIQIFADHKNTHGFPAYQANTSLVKDSTLSIATISPSAGALAGGTLLTITGRNFKPGAAVDLDGSPCLVTTLSSTTISCTTSAHTAGNVDVTVINTGINTATMVNAYTYQAAPTVSNVLPYAGALAGGTLITITGTGFITGATVDLSGSPCLSATVLNDTTLTCTTSSHAAGAVSVTVSNTDGQSGTLAAGYTYQAAPTVSAVSPNLSSIAGGMAITVTGSDFLAGATVELGGSVCTGTTVVNSTTLTCTSPAHTAGIVTIKVTNTDNQEGSLANIFAYGETALNVTLAGKLSESAGLTLKNNTTGETLALIDNGTTQFTTPWNGQTSYSVSITAQPVNNTCTISNNAGTIPSATATNIIITCIPTTYRLGGIITGLGAGETITIKGNNTLGTDTNQETFTGIGADLYYELPEERYAGRYYSLSIVSSSPTKKCTFTDPTSDDAILTANKTDINITCTARTVGSCDNQTAELWGPTNGAVYAILCDGQDNIYIGGTFSRIAPIVGSLFSITDTGVLKSIPKHKFSGIALVTTPDGQGGWYVGGEFKKIGKYTRNGIAHIFSDSTLDPNWAPSFNDTVTTIKRDGDYLYVGGWFTSVNGIPRNYVAKISTNAILDTTWDPSANYAVFSLDVKDNDVYMGGVFTSVNGLPRNYLAKVSKDGIGSVDTLWTPAPDNFVRTIRATNYGVFIGGDFLNISSVPRQRIALIDSTTASLSSWAPDADNKVHKIEVTDTTIYIMGDFDNISSTARTKISAYNLPALTQTTFAPNLNGSVYAFLQDDNWIYLGGFFQTANSLTRNGLARFSRTTNNIDTTWEPLPSGPTYEIQKTSDGIIIGGNIVYLGGKEQKRLAKISTTTGKLIDEFVPSFNNDVYTLAQTSSGTIIAGGLFTTPQNYIVELTPTTGTSTPWNPGLNAFVRRILIDDSYIFVGGGFTTASGATRTYVASFNNSDKTLTSFSPFITGGTVSSMLLNNSDLFLGGSFTSVNLTPRNYIAKIDKTNGTLSAWNPSPNSSVYSMAYLAGNLFIGGGFTTINGFSRGYLGKILDDTNGTLDPSWAPGANNIVRSIVTNNTDIYIAGDFTQLNTTNYPYVAKISPNTNGAIDPLWRPTPTSASVNVLYFKNNSIYTGGSFWTIGGQLNGRFARLPENGDGLIP